MNIIHFTNGAGHADVAPESYVNQGASRLIATHNTEARAMTIRPHQRRSDIVREAVNRIDHGLTANHMSAVY